MQGPHWALKARAGSGPSVAQDPELVLRLTWVLQKQSVRTILGSPILPNSETETLYLPLGATLSPGIPPRTGAYKSPRAPWGTWLTLGVKWK